MKTEKETRQEIIDKQLFEAGWNVDNHSQVISEFDVKKRSEPQISSGQSTYYVKHEFSDYVLLGKDGKPLAVVEAKKSSRDAGLGREQAKQYCYNIQKENAGELPFCFYTNGNDIFFWNLENRPPIKVLGFPTRDDLERFQYIRKNHSSLASELINTTIAGRDYQINAIRSVMEAMERKRNKLLLVMATGTGKTRTCIALVDALMRADWAERVLFLVDRIALRDQALEAFKEHLPNEPRWPKPEEKSFAHDRRIYVSTYPSMLNIIRDKKTNLSPFFFDLIIVDESHRSIYNTYQGILKYFNTITVGLTATPTDIIDHNTFKIFECEDGLPTFAYSYEEAVNNIPPYLSNFQVMKIMTKFQKDGISKRTISLEDQKKMILEGKEVAEINFEGTDIEKSVENRGTNALIVKEFMEECIKDSDGVLPGKTIFFCATISHARRIEKIFDSLYPEYSGELAKVLVSDDSRVYGKGGLLDQFTNNNMPRIAISVDMLDTGIDVRELVNLVFAKPVYSYTKFWQMIGRGTRLLEPTKIKSWCPEKDNFLILDCWDNFEYFKLNPKGKELKSQIPLPVKLFSVRLDKIDKALNLGENKIVIKEVDKLKNQISELPADSVVVRESASDLDKINQDSFWNNITVEDIEFLRQNIKPLFRTVSQSDFKAMRFEKDVLETSLANLANEKEKFATLKDNLIEKISGLPLSVNIVANEEEIITKSQSNQFWTTITDNDFDTLTDKLAPLMKYRDSGKTADGVSKLDLKDILDKKEFVKFGPENESVSIAKYKEMVENKIIALVATNPILQKIKDGENINEEESEQLADALQNEHPNITIDLLRRTYKNKKAQFIQLLKHILGIEILESFPETVSKAIEQFIQIHSDLTTTQLDFLKLLSEYIIDNGDIQKRNLIQAPFTLIHPDGIRGVFSPNEIKELVEIANNLVA